MRAQVKYHVIYRHREQYSVSAMCKFFSVSRSGYYDFVKRLGRPERNAELVEKIREYQEHCDNTYGYRRMWRWLNSKDIHKNPKTVLKIMKEHELLSEIRRKRKWVNLGQEAHKYKNLLNRQFHANCPKAECIYRHKPRTLAEADELINRYIYFYNHERIQLKTGVAPLTLRHSA